MSRIKEPKYSALEKNNEKLLEIQKTVANIKEVHPHFIEFVKSLTKFCDQTKFWMDSGDATRNALTKIAGVRKYDEIAKSVRSVDSCFMEMFKTRKECSESYRDNLIIKWGEDLQRDRSLQDFEKSFKVKRAGSLKKIKKAESNYAKACKPRAMKKAPEKAEEMKKELEDAVQGHEDMLAQELHVIVLMERKRYAFFLRQISEALGTELKGMKACIEAVEKCQDEIQPGMCGDIEENFPVETKKLIGAQELLRSGSLHVVASSSSSSLILRSPPTDDDDSDSDSDKGSDDSDGEKKKEKETKNNNDSDSKEKTNEKERKGNEEEGKNTDDEGQVGGQGNGEKEKKSKGKKKGKRGKGKGKGKGEEEASVTEESTPRKVSTPPPPSSAPFNGSDVLRKMSSPRPVEPLKHPNSARSDGRGVGVGDTTPVPSSSSSSSSSTSEATAADGEDLGEYLSKLDAPPPPPPVRDTEDMDDELARILSSFSGN